jgi:hypothetical protein
MRRSAKEVIGQKTAEARTVAESHFTVEIKDFAQFTGDSCVLTSSDISIPEFGASW